MRLSKRLVRRAQVRRGQQGAKRSQPASLGPWVVPVVALCVVSLAVGLSVSGPLSVADASTPTPLIIDTDIWSNADDVGALATAFALQMNGEDQVIAITVNTRTDRPSVATKSWECVAAIAQYYNSPGVPIGADMPDNGSQLDSPDFLTPCAALASPSTPAPGNAVSVLRSALEGQPDHSVVIAEIGYEENLQALLNSSGDSTSSLTGSELVAQKVKMLVVTGGQYPTSGTSPENNFAGNPVAAADVAAHWPTKVVYSGYEVGENVDVGNTIYSKQPASSPVRAAYDAYTGPGNTIPSWDLTTVYHAVVGASDTDLTETGPGQNVVDTSREQHVHDRVLGDEYYLTISDLGGLDSSLESLLDVVPPLPVDSSLPTISGVVAQGQTLTEVTRVLVQQPDRLRLSVAATATPRARTVSRSLARAARHTLSRRLTLDRRYGWSRPRATTSARGPRRRRERRLW